MTEIPAGTERYRMAPGEPQREFDTMQAIVTMLEDLHPATRLRVLHWIIARFEMT